MSRTWKNYWNIQNTQKREQEQHQINMDDYSKAVEETKMDHNEQKERMCVIGLERVKSQRVK